MRKVLIVIDGSEHAGTATAYLINRARGCRRNDLLVVNVDPAVPNLSASPLADLTSLHTASLRAIAGMAGPWLDDAGIACEFRDEVGEVADVITGLTKQGGIQEVVVVSDARNPVVRILKRYKWFCRGLSLDELSASTGLPVSLIVGQTIRRLN